MLREQLAREPFESPKLILSDRIPDFAVTGRYEPEWLEKVEPSDFSLAGYTHHAPLTAPMAVRRGRLTSGGQTALGGRSEDW
ncbi:hypothetical protein G6F31_020069 [Rhizopus arrhizus]|nr:hypothetical protein G6F31_020069 [Rhizopus arrhizus]